MAEAYLKKRIAEEELPIEVRSAGTLGVDGMSPTPEALRVLAEEDIDAEKYKSKTQFEYYNPHSAFTNPQLSDSSTLSQEGQERSNPLLDTP